MNPSRLFIERPVATSLLMVAILLIGMVAFKYLPLSALPQVDYPTIQVQTFYPGGSPDVMTSTVTAPLEKQLGQMPGLNQMSSISSTGASIITLQFDLSLSLDIAEQEVQAAINAANSLLPTDLPAPPIYAKVNPADAPILTLALTSKTMPLTEVQDLADTRLAQKISQLPGVGLVSVSGGQRAAVRVKFNPKALAAYGIGIDDLKTSISNANVNTAKGSLDGPTRAYTIDANDQLKSAVDYQNVVIAYKNGAPVRLKDVAEIIDGTENDQLGAWMNDTPAIIVNVKRQPGANVIKVVDTIKEILPDLQSGLPTALDVAVLTDRTTTIRASVEDVEFELILSVALVVLVIFLFLRNLPATLIPSLSVPLSLIGTFAIMNLAGFSLNNLSLMALTIATGFVVDDAIVMIENIDRYLEKGETPKEAALKGSSQIGFTIISLTVSLLAVLIPLLFMGDVVGRLFREFAITLAVTIILSAIVSLTLVPMMCAHLLKPAREMKETGLAAWLHRRIDAMIEAYGRQLTWVLHHRPLTIKVTIATLALTFLLAWFIPKGFFPVQDTGLLQGVTSASPSVSYASMAERQRQVADIILKDKDVTSLSSFVGVDDSNSSLNTGRFLINLKPHSQRSDDAETIGRRLQTVASAQAGITLYLQAVQDLTIDTNQGRTQYQFVVEDADASVLETSVSKLMKRLAKEPEIQDLTTDAQDRGKALNVVVDRDAASRLGISMSSIDSALYSAFGQRIISTIFTQSNQYRVILQSNAATSPDSRRALEAIRFTTNASTQAPLTAFARIEEVATPLQVNHLGQFPASTISFNLKEGISLGDAVDKIEVIQKELALPISTTLHFQGAAMALRSSLANEAFLILAAILTVYIVLGILYESYIHPITILSTLPSAGVGALLALWLTGHDLGIIGIIGMILLIGIVKKNAIMMIDFALDAERNEGKSPEEAIYQACLLRFRPILMTTMAALLAGLPLMLGWGVGSELRHPLGLAIVGGLILSQILTLFTTPVIYLAFDALAKRLGITPVHAIKKEEEEGA